MYFLTLNIYGHLLPKVLRSATDRMGALARDEETDETQQTTLATSRVTRTKSPSIARRASAFQCAIRGGAKGTRTPDPLLANQGHGCLGLSTSVRVCLPDGLNAHEVV